MARPPGRRRVCRRRPVGDPAATRHRMLHETAGRLV